MNESLHENIMKLRSKLNILQDERAKRLDKKNRLSKNLVEQMNHFKKLENFADKVKRILNKFCDREMFEFFEFIFIHF